MLPGRGETSVSPSGKSDLCTALKASRLRSNAEAAFLALVGSIDDLGALPLPFASALVVLDAAASLTLVVEPVLLSPAPLVLELGPAAAPPFDEFPAAALDDLLLLLTAATSGSSALLGGLVLRDLPAVFLAVAARALEATVKAPLESELVDSIASSLELSSSLVDRSPSARSTTGTGGGAASLLLLPLLSVLGFGLLFAGFGMPLEVMEAVSPPTLALVELDTLSRREA